MCELFLEEVNQYNLTWKEYLQLYPDCRMCTVSSIPVYRSCLRTRLSLNLKGSWKSRTYRGQPVECSRKDNQRDLYEWFEQVLPIIETCEQNFQISSQLHCFQILCLVSQTCCLPTQHMHISHPFSDVTMLLYFIYTNVKTDHNQSIACTKFATSS